MSASVSHVDAATLRIIEQDAAMLRAAKGWKRFPGPTDGVSIPLTALEPEFVDRVRGWGGNHWLGWVHSIGREESHAFILRNPGIQEQIIRELHQAEIAAITALPPEAWEISIRPAGNIAYANRAFLSPEAQDAIASNGQRVGHFGEQGDLYFMNPGALNDQICRNVEQLRGMTGVDSALRAS